jgi:GxxExxY protein
MCALSDEASSGAAAADSEGKIQPQIEHGLNTDRIQVGADLWVADRVIVELKVARQYQSEDEARLINELKATGIRVGHLINFGRTKVEFKRFVF